MELQAPPLTKSRLAGIITGAVREPDRIFIMAVEGWGKTTFGANAPNPIFITAEEGAAQKGVARFPAPDTFADVLADVDTLLNESHPYKTLVIDTVDALEQSLWDQLCKKEQVDMIEKVAGGYGKGYVLAAKHFRDLLAKLDFLRKRKGMEIIVTSHTKTKNFSNPIGADYTRYEPTLHSGVAALFKGWPDTALFGMFDDTAIDVSKGTEIKTLTTKAKAKGVFTGHRIIKTQHSAAWHAKNRWNLPPEIVLPDDERLSYQVYADLRDKFWDAKLYADPGTLYAEMLKLAEQLPDGERREKAIGFAESNKGNAPSLQKGIEKVKGYLAELVGNAA